MFGMAFIDSYTDEVKDGRTWREGSTCTDAEEVLRSLCYDLWAKKISKHSSIRSITCKSMNGGSWYHKKFIVDFGNGSRRIYRVNLD